MVNKLKPRTLQMLLVLLSAVLTGVARLPYHLGWLGLVGLIPLLYYFDQGHRKGAQLLRDAFIYNAVGLTIWLHWIWGVTSWGFVGIIIFFTLYFWGFFALIQTIWRKLPRYKYVGFILLFLAAEYLMNFTECRFPWINQGYALTDYTILLQAADLGGVTLLSLLLLVINVLLYKTLHGKVRNLLWLALLGVAWIAYGGWCLTSIKLQNQPARITLMQPSIPQSEKWETERFNELYARYLKLTAAAARDSAQLVIWPEAAMPAYVLQDNSVRPLVQNVANGQNIDLFTGFPDIQPAPLGYPGKDYYYNAATLFHPMRPPDQPYYKVVLVPVGERIPFLKVFPFLWGLQFGQANWEYGPGPRYFQSGKWDFSPQICFEIAFPELNRKMAYRNVGEFKGPKPDKIDYLVNITNDAWFGRSVGPWIHGMMTKCRAIENRIQIDRCANTGITMVVDPLGRVVHRTDMFAITNLKAPLQTCARIPLYYYLWWWPRLACLFALELVIRALWRKKLVNPRTGGKHE